MAATEGGKIVGMGAGSMDPSCAVLEEIVCDDDCIAYGMAKALLNAIDRGGIKQVYIKNSRLAALAERLRFSKTAQGVYALSLEGYFTGGCEKN